MSEEIDPKEVQQFGNLELIARQVVEGFITGLHKSPFHGFSVEFSEHRQYNTGESTRDIDWKLYARTDKLFVKRYEEETNLRCRIVIDNSSSMYYPVVKSISPQTPNKIFFSVYAAAALIHLLKVQRDAVGLSVFSDRVEIHTNARATTMHQKLLYHELDKIFHTWQEGNFRKTFATEALHQIAEQTHKRSLVVIFSDMMESNTGTEALFSALQHLRHNKHEVILFHTVDGQKEMEFGFDNRPYKFVDMENGEELKIHPNEIKKDYIRAITAFRNELKIKCGQYNIDFVEADINQGFHQVLFGYLIKRGRMY